MIEDRAQAIRTRLRAQRQRERALNAAIAQAVVAGANDNQLRTLRVERAALRTSIEDMLMAVDYLNTQAVMPALAG